MSTRVGTVQAPKAGDSILLAVFLTSLVMLTVAVVAISLERDQGRQGETTFVGRHVVNTPTELSGGIIGGPAASFQGIIAGSSSIAAAATPDVQAAIVAAREAAEASGELSAGTTANTPSELSGGLFDQNGRHQRI
jgi:hypothetical protein